MDRKQRIYLYICSNEYIPLTKEELMLVLDVPKEDENEFLKLCEELICEGKIFLSKKKRLVATEKNTMQAGILRCNARRHFGFVIEEGFEDIYIGEKSMGTAIDGDRVLVRLEKSRGAKREGSVVSVLGRGNTVISAVITDKFYAIPDNKRIFKRINLLDTLGAMPGDRVLVEITDYLKNGAIDGVVTSVLGSSRELKSLCSAIVYEHGIKPAFDDAVISEAQAMPEEINISDYPDRTDFTQDTIFTIDGEDARDFDDAVSIKTLENGNYLLGVHIADVSEYVTTRSQLDISARERGTSVYLPNKVIPMLPTQLSNGICSLNPDVLRLTLSIIMEINPQGEVVRHSLEKGIIRSCRRMTYDDAAKIIDGDTNIQRKFADISSSILKMQELAKILFDKRAARGSVNFDFPETRVIIGKDGFPQDIAKVVRNDAHRLIEEFMLVANETVAEFAFWADLPFIYRVHEQPSPDKAEGLKRFLGNFGLVIKGKELHPRELQQILDKLKNTENETLIATYMLRSLMKAEYLPECDGHFGLAAKYYCHFTSPIRRYPDLIVHRILKEFLSGNDLTKYRNDMFDIAAHSSDTEREAELCERDVTDLFKTAFISDYVGCEFEATVSGTAAFGMFCELENGIEGMIRLETIEGDYYVFDENSRYLTGERYGRIFKIGDKLKIEVVRADIETRQIDFVLAEEKKNNREKRKRKWKNSR